VNSGPTTLRPGVWAFANEAALCVCQGCERRGTPQGNFRMDIIDTKIMPEAGTDAALNGALRTNQVLDTGEGWGFFPTVSLLWNCRRQISRFVVAGFVFGLLIAVIIPPKFRSITQLMPPDTQSNTGMSMLSNFLGEGTSGGSTGSDLGSLAGSLLGIKTPGELFIGVLGSRTVQDELINRFDLRKEYHVKRYEQARKELTENTELSLDRKSGIILSLCMIVIPNRLPTWPENTLPNSTR